MTAEDGESTALWRFAVGYALRFSVGLLLGLAFVLPIGFYIIADILAPIVLAFGLGFSLGVTFSQTQLTPLKSRIIRTVAGILIFIATVFVWLFLMLRGGH